ncbi:hypothetical protein RNQ46_23790, partial [Escherichia coli]|nr:hypothetical protein [Escherichia coli]
MKKLILAAAVAGAVLLSSAAQAQTTPEGYQLQQVLMMSRHGTVAKLAMRQPFVLFKGLTFQKLC